MENILVISAHPDDETFGAGGTIAKLVKMKKNVYWCVVTKPYPPDWTEDVIKVKRKEALNAARILGFKEIYFLEYPTAKLDTIPIKSLADEFTRLVKDLEPDTVFIPFKGDMNQDHKRVFDAMIISSKPIPTQSVKRVISYETPSSTEYSEKLCSNIFIPNLYVDITNEIKTKIESAKCYKTELKEFPHPRSLDGIIIKAKLRGMEVGVPMAEAFMIMRWIEK